MRFARSGYCGGLATDDADPFVRAQELLADERYDEVLALSRERLSVAPDADDAVKWRLTLGRALAALERWHELGVEMVRLLADEPDLPEAWLLDGEALLGQRLFDEAESALRRVLVARGDEASRARALLDEIAVVRKAGVPEAGDELYDGTEERTEIDPPGSGRLAELLAPGVEPGVEPDFDDEATRERPSPAKKTEPLKSEPGLYAEAEPQPFAADTTTSRARKPTPPARPRAAAPSTPLPSPVPRPSPFAPPPDASPVPDGPPPRPPSRASLRLGVVVAATLGVVLVLSVQWWRRARQHAAERTAIERLLESGNYDDFQQAAQRAERMGELSQAARVFAQLAWEFGIDPQPAVALLERDGESADSHDANLARAWIALARGDLATVDQLTAGADSDSRYVAGWSLLVAGKLDAARAAFSAVLAGRSLDPLAAHALGLVEWQAGGFDRADAAFAQALSANANQLSTVIDRARLSIVAGDDGARRRARETLRGVLQKLGAQCSPGQLARAELGLAALAAHDGDARGEQQALDEADKLAAQTDVLARREIAQMRAARPVAPPPPPPAQPTVAAAPGPLTLVQLDALLAAGNRGEAIKRINTEPRSPSLSLVFRGELILASHAPAAENLGLSALARRGTDASDKQAAWLLVARARIMQGDRKQGRRAYQSAVALDGQSEVGKLAAAELAGLGQPITRSSAAARTDRRAR